MIYYESILARRDDSVPKVQKEVTIMNSYETLYIIKPTVEDEAREALIAKFAAIITENGGEVATARVTMYSLTSRRRQSCPWSLRETSRSTKISCVI